MISDRAGKATEIFSSGLNCAQGVLAAFAPSYGIDADTALKIACGFGGGMARLQEVCGAVTGAFMVIGAARGSTDPGDAVAKEKTYELVREFDRRFRQMHGSILCRDLLGVNLNTEEGKTLMKERNLTATVCAKCVHDAAAIVERLI